MSFGVTNELSFIEKLRVELNNLFIVAALHAGIIHLFFNASGPRNEPSFYINFLWLSVLTIPFVFNYYKKYLGARLYTIIIPTLGLGVVHMLHGIDVRIEPGYLLLIVACFCFFRIKLALVIGTLIFTYYIIIINVLMSVGSPFDLEIMPPIPFFYISLALVCLIGMTVKIIGEIISYNILSEDQKNELTLRNNELKLFSKLASHDLKSPLRNIISYSELAAKDVPSECADKTKTHLGLIKKNAEHMSELLSDIQVFSVVSDYTEQESKTISLDEIKAIVIQNLDEFISERNGIVKTSELGSIVGNKSELIILFQNIIQNGLKYNTSEVPLVEIVTERSPRNVKVHFIDNGIGIKEEYQEQIFGFFQRLHSQHEYEGTGLGLALCKTILNRNSGSIELKSDHGSGSIFTLNFEQELT